MSQWSSAEFKYKPWCDFLGWSTMYRSPGKKLPTGCSTRLLKLHEMHAACWIMREFQHSVFHKQTDWTLIFCQVWDLFFLSKLLNRREARKEDQVKAPKYSSEERMMFRILQHENRSICSWIGYGVWEKVELGKILLFLCWAAEEGRLNLSRLEIYRRYWGKARELTLNILTLRIPLDVYVEMSRKLLYIQV